MSTQSPFGTAPIQTLSRLELINKAITAGKRVYVPVCVTIYDSGIVFDFEYVEDDENGFHKIQTESYTFPFANAGRLLPVRIHDCDFFWDRNDFSFRWLPTEPAKNSYSINPWISFWDNGELRIEKKYAEHNLSFAALDYAFKKTAEYYVWNTDDYSHMPVIYEIPGAFDEFLYKVEFCLCPHFINIHNYISTYTESYCSAAPEDSEELLANYKQRYARKLWTPEG